MFGLQLKQWLPSTYRARRDRGPNWSSVSRLIGAEGIALGNYVIKENGDGNSWSGSRARSAPGGRRLTIASEVGCGPMQYSLLNQTWAVRVGVCRAAEGRRRVPRALKHTNHGTHTRRNQRIYCRAERTPSALSVICRCGGDTVNGTDGRLLVRVDVQKRIDENSSILPRE